MKMDPSMALTRANAKFARRFRYVEKKCGADGVAIERLFFGRNTTTAEMVFQARGVALLAAARKGLVPYEPKPSEVKLAVCGNGVAEKQQVQGMVRCLLGLNETPRPDDAADALAIAITGLSLAMYSLAGRASAQ